MAVFSPGETIVHEFHLPFGGNDISEVIVSYYQNGRIIFIKHYNGEYKSIPTGSQFTVGLLQEESLLFDDNSDFYVQLNVMFNSGTRATSREMRGRNIKQHIREAVNSNV